MGNAIQKRKCSYPNCSVNVVDRTLACRHHLCPVVGCVDPKQQFQEYCLFHLEEW